MIFLFILKEHIYEVLVYLKEINHKEFCNFFMSVGHFVICALLLDDNSNDNLK